MSDPDTKKAQLIRTNTILWLTAMALPAFFHFAFAIFASGPVKFPWPIIAPLLMVGLLLSSNRLIETAARDGKDGK